MGAGAENSCVVVEGALERVALDDKWGGIQDNIGTGGKGGDMEAYCAWVVPQHYVGLFHDHVVSHVAPYPGHVTYEFAIFQMFDLAGELLQFALSASSQVISHGPNKRKMYQ